MLHLRSTVSPAFSRPRPSTMRVEHDIPESDRVSTGSPEDNLIRPVYAPVPCRRCHNPGRASTPSNPPNYKQPSFLIGNMKMILNLKLGRRGFKVSSTRNSQNFALKAFHSFTRLSTHTLKTVMKIHMFTSSTVGVLAQHEAVLGDELLVVWVGYKSVQVHSIPSMWPLLRHKPSTTSAVLP